MVTDEDIESIPIPTGYIAGCYFEREKHEHVNLPEFFKTFEELKAHTVRIHGGWKG